MEQAGRTTIDDRILDEWQRDFPLVASPFEVMASRLGIREGELLTRLERLQTAGIVARVGGVVRPNTVGASTLAAVAVPDLQTDDVAAILCEEPGINHVYLRENDWNLWFVVTGPDRRYIDGVLNRIERKVQRSILDLRLEQAYHIDLGFSLEAKGRNRTVPDRHHAEPAVLSTFEIEDRDRALLQTLTDGLPLVSRPFLQIAGRLGESEQGSIDRLRRLVTARVVPRIGVIVRHRALGWRSNAMVVFDVEPDEIDAVGPALARAHGVNLCYRRTRYANQWPYNLYCMIHARSRPEAFDAITNATLVAKLESAPREVLFSLRCYKQTGALLTAPREAA